MDEITRMLETAEEKYDKLVFKTDAGFNEPAPDPIVAFVVGAVLSLMGCAMWLRRVQVLKTAMAQRKPPIVLEGSTLVRAYISCAIDSDDPFYTIVSYGAVSFLFLGGIQLNYNATLLAMIVTYAASALGETLRILLAWKHTPSLADLVVTSEILASQMRSVKTQLSPSNVYEDLGRGKTIVLMVFFTQVILISFVCVDVFDSETGNCRDGTNGCPIGGTVGSWGFYVLGIFMACVFQLGPKTKFGESEQNPAYWLQLLLFTKHADAKVTWYDPVKDRTNERHLTAGDWVIWVRFLMSFLINGVGYHILVHALPIQVASQSSLTGVVFRAVGMMYLVDLDDTPGYKLTVVVKPLEEPKPEAKTGEEPKKEEPKKDQEMQAISNDAIEQATLEIIEEAKKKLDALARGEFSAGTPGNKGRAANMLLGVGALATDEDAAADKDKSQGLAVPSADAADDDGGAEGETVEA